MTEPPTAVEPAQALETLIAAHQERLLRLCRMLLADGSEAEEVVQDVFLKAWRAAMDSKAPEAWPRWLTRVTINGCRDRARSGWWTRFRRWSDPIETVPLVSPAPSPEDVAMGEETRRRIWTSFRTLSPRQREVFALRYVEGWSTDDAAAALGMTSGSAKRHLFRAIRRLRGALRDAR